MGNTEYRGKIVWFLITCRPDLLPIDLKRQGRAEEHLALFYPETHEEHDALFRIMLKKSGITTPVQSITEVIDDPVGPVGRRHRGHPGARAARVRRRAADGNAAVSAETLRHAFADFIPATSPLERELQILVAVQECTSREVLPESYRAMEREAVLARINELRALLNS